MIELKVTITFAIILVAAAVAARLGMEGAVIGAGSGGSWQLAAEQRAQSKAEVEVPQEGRK